MKNYFRYFTLLTLVFMITSCSDDLLNNSGVPGESQPTQFLTNAQTGAATDLNPLIPAAFVAGIYAQQVEVGSGGSGSQTDFGQKGFDIYSDMLCGDMALSVSTFGWYRADLTEFQAPIDFTNGTNRIPWRYYYRLIRSANTVIDGFGGNDIVPELEDSRYSLGQAKAMRAHSYFYLTQFFQKEYNPSEEILPLYTSAIATNLPKSTAAEVYDLMEQDLNDAIALLDGFNRADKSQVNQDIAKAILAYVLGAKGGRDAEVASLTQDVINNGAFSMLSASDVTNGFNDYNNPSWMWGINLTEVIGLGLVSWWGQVDAFSYSYGWAGDYKVIDSNLFSQISDDDARKDQFLDNPESGRNLQPLFKFYATDQIGGVSTTVTADYVYMRIEEMYLLNAEANARIGNTGLARENLKALLDRRVDDSSYIDSLDGQDLLDEIYLQTRIELWGEGKSYLAMKRFKATTVRGDNHLTFQGVPIPYNDERLQFEIPIDEIQNNPFIGSQND